jgi:hypothetical protein
MTSESIDPADEISYDDVREEPERERDGVSSLRDIEAEAGDEEAVTDDFIIDRRAATEVGADLDRIGGEEPRME